LRVYYIEKDKSAEKSADYRGVKKPIAKKTIKLLVEEE